MQVANARMMGRFAVQMGSSEATKRLGGLEGQVRDTLVGFGLLPPEVSSRPVSEDAAAPVSVIATPTDAKPAARTAGAAAKRPAARASTPVSAETKQTAPKAASKLPNVDDLAIPGYDSLAASQVVARLAGLRPKELKAVQQYELGNRARKTILGRIAQLQAS